MAANIDRECILRIDSVRMQNVINHLLPMSAAILQFAMETLKPKGAEIEIKPDLHLVDNHTLAVLTSMAHMGLEYLRICDGAREAENLRPVGTLVNKPGYKAVKPGPKCPRADCAYCGKNVAVRTTGVFYLHYLPYQQSLNTTGCEACPGSENSPESMKVGCNPHGIAPPPPPQLGGQSKLVICSHCNRKIHPEAKGGLVPDHWLMGAGLCPGSKQPPSGSPGGEGPPPGIPPLNIVPFEPFLLDDFPQPPPSPPPPDPDPYDPGQDS